MFTTKNLLILIAKQTAVAFGVVLIAIISVFFLSRAIDNSTNAVIKSRALTDKLSKRTELFSVIAHDVEMINGNEKHIENAFVPADNIFEFIVALESLVKKSGATQSFQPASPVQAGEGAPFPLSTINYSNTLFMNVTTFSEYLKMFESLPYFTRIDGLSFSSSDASGWNKGGTASYRAVLYTKTNN